MAECKYFKIGDYVDVKDCSYGSWFTGKLIKIKKSSSTTTDPNTASSSTEKDRLIYVVQFTGYVLMSSILFNIYYTHKLMYLDVPTNHL